MKKLLIASFLLTFFQVFTVANSPNAIDVNNCYKTVDSVDYDYCMKRKTANLKANFDGRYNKWKKKKLSEKDKKKVLGEVNAEILLLKKMIAERTEELKILEAGYAKTEKLKVHGEKKESKEDKLKKKLKKIF